MTGRRSFFAGSTVEAGPEQERPLQGEEGGGSCGEPNPYQGAAGELWDLLAAGEADGVRRRRGRHVPRTIHARKQ